MKRSIAIIGDVHGLVDYYCQLLKENGINQSIQIGDMGLGFGKGLDAALEAYLDHLHNMDPDAKHLFFRGNHDDPKACNDFPYYMGDWGYSKTNDIFWIGGAWSIDWEGRTKDVDWWEDEQLTDKQWKEVREAYLDIKPRFVLSHDCPLDMYSKMLGYYGQRNIPTLTSRELNGLFFHHKPKKWIFGHHHMSIVHEEEGCEFRCLNELEIYELRLNDE